MMRRRGSPLLGSAVAIALLLAGFCFAIGHLHHALLVYLASWLFLLGVVVGSMTLLLIHTLTGGDWGWRLGPALSVATRLFPYAAIAVLPLLVGMHLLFPWLHSGASIDDPYLPQQRWYLNAPGLVIRTVVVFAIWAWYAYRLVRGMNDNAQPVSQRFAAGGLVVMLLTVSVAAIDWVMSLVPRWHSTDIALLLFTSQLLLALALAVLMYLAGDASAKTVPARSLRDFGSLMLVLVLGWGYVSFIDYLTAWIADLPAETAWYAPRLLTGWRWWGVGVAFLGLGIPFFSLLMGRVKTSRRALCVIAVISLFAQWIDLIWLVLPSAVVRGVSLRWTDPLICIGLLGFCAVRYRGLLHQTEGMR